jgi:hypothetical protein
MMETALVNILVQSAVAGSRVYSSIPLNPSFPLQIYSISDIDPFTTRTTGGDTAGTVTSHSQIPGWMQYLVRLEIVGQDYAQVQNAKDALFPYINGFNGEADNGDEITIQIDGYRMEGKNEEANYITGVFDLTVGHKGA